MTRKDYNLIVRALKKFIDNKEKQDKNFFYLSHCFCQELLKDNKKFNVGKFENKLFNPLKK
jgi:hypothetical protein